MPLTSHKTKIVATIGPASESPEIMEKMIRTGMQVARVNFSHGDFDYHAMIMQRLRDAAAAVGRRVAILADLPGPKIRIGQLREEPVELKSGDYFSLTTTDMVGDARRVSVTLPTLPDAVKTGETLFLNDGLIEMEVVSVEGCEVVCRVVSGGELRSKKGLNLPGISLGIGAFTEHDRRCLEFALQQGADAVSQSFVESGKDIVAVREAAAALGYQPFIVAKIERSNALANLENILDEADGLMIARGDLGVEIPIQEIASVQKKIMLQANLKAKPVITATQMLESMVTNPRPTRAEVTDVANAILDGTDCVMLSGESAMGKYPVESVAMLVKIARSIEPYHPGHQVRQILRTPSQKNTLKAKDLIPFSVDAILRQSSPVAVFVPTRSGATALDLARLRPSVWIIAVSSLASTCQRLLFSYGVYPVHADHPEDWKTYVQTWLQAHNLAGKLVVLTEGPSSKHPEGNNRIELIDLTMT